MFRVPAGYTDLLKYHTMKMSYGVVVLEVDFVSGVSF